MPIDAVNTPPRAVTDYSVGATAKAAEDAKEARANAKLSDEEKRDLLVKKVNEGQKLDKAPVTAENQGKLGKDDFMKLLIATLKYQDPSSPMDTQKLLEQTSLMTNMEQMVKMTEASQKAFESQQKMQSAAMVGKTVVYDATDEEGNSFTTAGKVDAVEFLAKGDALLHVGKTKIKLDKVLGVADGNEDTPTNGVAEAAKPAAQKGASAVKKPAPSPLDKADKAEKPAEKPEGAEPFAPLAANAAAAAANSAPAAPPADEAARRDAEALAAGQRAALKVGEDAAQKSGNIDATTL